MGEWAQVAEQTLKAMPEVFQQLQEEGMRYFTALQQISLGDAPLEAHASEIAEDALSGFETRILHRAPTGKAKALSEQALAPNTRPQ